MARCPYCSGRGWWIIDSEPDNHSCTCIRCDGTGVLMDVTTFINKIGRHITHAVNFKVGDIVGRVIDSHSIRLYCIKKIRLNWEPKCLITEPEVHFHEPHIGLTIQADKVKRLYIHTPMPGSTYECGWVELTKEEMLKKYSQDLEFYKDNVFQDSVFDIYLIEDEKYKKLGNLINDVIVPT